MQEVLDLFQIIDSLVVVLIDWDHQSSFQFYDLKLIVIGIDD